MRRLKPAEIRHHDCTVCDGFIDNRCKYPKCLYFDTPTRRQVQRATTVFCSIRQKENSINKSLVYALVDSGFTMAETAEKLNLRPQKVVEIIEERRRKDGVLQNL
jgi:hypothetical protein